MITELSPEQIAKFPDYVRKWTDIGLSTEPADRPKAEEAIKSMYLRVGLDVPRIVWCGSPLGNFLTKATLQKLNQDSAWDSVWDYVRDSVWVSVTDAVSDSVRLSVTGSVWASVSDSVSGSVSDSVSGSVGDSVRGFVRDSVRDAVRDSVIFLGESMYGQHDAGWISFYDYFWRECGVKGIDKLTPIMTLAESAGWTLPYKNICFVSERHNTLHRDDEGRLHNETAPALTYPDGFSIYAWHGVRVPEDVIMRPESITADRIASEDNAEVRRVMLERFGRDRFVELPECIEVHRDDWGILYRNDIIRDINNDPYCFVKVVNSTPEPDGTFKDYILRVRPNIKTAYEAVQSTFPRIDQFTPSVET